MYKFFNEGIKKTESSYPLRGKKPVNIPPSLNKWDEEDYEEKYEEPENGENSSNEQSRKLERSAIVYRTSFCDFKIVTYR